MLVIVRDSLLAEIIHWSSTFYDFNGFPMSFRWINSASSGRQLHIWPTLRPKTARILDLGCGNARLSEDTVGLVKLVGFGAGIMVYPWVMEPWTWVKQVFFNLGRSQNNMSVPNTFVRDVPGYSNWEGFSPAMPTAIFGALSWDWHGYGEIHGNPL